MIEDPTFYLQMKENAEMKSISNKNDNIYNNSNPSDNEGYKMVIMVRTDLNMKTGKIAAQVGHGGRNHLIILISFRSL
jgi:hypothetical protein